MYELDPCDPDEFVGGLDYPDLEVTRSCDYDGCDQVASSWASPNGGDTHILDADIRMVVEAEFFDEPFISDASTEETTPDERHRSARTYSGLAAVSSLMKTWLERLGPTVFAPVVGHALESVPLRQLPEGEAGQSTAQYQLSGVVRAAGDPVGQARILTVKEQGRSVKIHAVRTDEDGRFSVAESASGVQEILVVAEGYTPARVEVGSSVDSANNVEVVLQEASSFAGIVVDEEEHPMRDVTVEIRYPPLPPQKGRYRLRGNWLRGRLTTSDNGEFYIENVRPNVTFEVVLYDESTGTTRSARSLQLSPGERRGGLVLRWKE